MKRSHRASKPNSKYSTSEEGLCSAKRKCESSGCPATHPVCFARVSERCAGNGWTSRWYHVTLGEHFCNECFEHFYRSHKDGHAEFERWKRGWSSKSRTSASLRLYMAERVLPYWVQCRRPECGKWRQLSKEVELTPEFVNTFQCHTVGKQNSCDMHEDERVQFVDSPEWLEQTRCITYLKNSPCAPFLSAYYLDGVGLSPTDNDNMDHKEKMCPYIYPFPKENFPMHAFALTPDMMSDREIEFFPLIAQHCPYSYLALRNTIMVLWALNPKEWLSKEKLFHHIICRGLSRVFCAKLLTPVISYLTQAQFINVGLVRPPTDFLSHSSNIQTSVIVIGAGMSGLSAAHTLHSFGYKVTVIEGRERIGGRIDNLPGSSSSYVLTGVTNNPISVIAYQAGLPLQEIQEACQLFMPDGSPVKQEVDRRIEFHYNAILDIISEWRKKKEVNADVSLANKFTEFHEEFISETQEYFANEEEQVIEFHLSNLEFACGCSLDQVSSLQWDQNENLPQFCGDHAISAHDGFQTLMEKLSEGLDVRLNSTVKSIDYGDSSGISLCTDIETLQADKVIITVPLSVLKAGTISFSPPLPHTKLDAIQKLGAGLVEKVTLKFAYNFWTKFTKGHEMFGCVPETKAHRGLFNLYYASPAKTCEQGEHFLTAYIVGQGINLMRDKSDEEIVIMCLTTLKSVFSEKVVPCPLWSHVSHWATDPLALMSFSYLPVGTTADMYDTMAQEIRNKLFFAGEATNQQFPQTITGAYLSGVREAWKIMDSIETDGCR